MVVGAIPYFCSPFVEVAKDGTRAVHPGYQRGAWYDESPWWGDGVRRRAGMRHVPLADLLNWTIDSGLRLVGNVLVRGLASCQRLYG